MGIQRLILSILLLAATAASGTVFTIGLGDDCPADADSRAGHWQGLETCFWPITSTIAVGDSVRFFTYADSLPSGPHNVVADDGSFRCAAGCDGDGEAGDGTPRDWTFQWRFTRTFTTPGIVNFHDEASGAKGTLIVEAPSSTTIDPRFTGVWYDPAQSGHGLIVEVLPDNRFSATWLAFNPAGTEQAWFTGVGIYIGKVASITEVQLPSGGRWIPNLDPDRIVRKAWGTLTFTFTDCSHGKVDFNSVAGYGTGSMDLRRLTTPAGLACF